MASSKQDGTAAATEQLDSMSIGESVERRKENETEPTPKNGTKTKGFCSACEKESDTLKLCNGCRCVWYCDKKCQNKHRKEHKKECRIIKKELDKRGGKLDLGTEEDIGPLGKLTPREECPICMQALPIHPKLQTYYTCCGKTICSGCALQHDLKSGDQVTCAFCRTAAPGSDEERLACLLKRVELKDAMALHDLAYKYENGDYGLPLDHDKCVDLHREAAALGNPVAHYTLGRIHHNGEMGLEQSEEEAIKHWEKAAEGGDLLSRHNLGYEAHKNGDQIAALRHLRLSASGGHRDSMEALIKFFEVGFLYHADLAEIVQTFYRAKTELRSKDRDQHIE